MQLKLHVAFQEACSSVMGSGYSTSLRRQAPPASPSAALRDEKLRNSLTMALRRFAYFSRALRGLVSQKMHGYLVLLAALVSLASMARSVGFFAFGV